MQMLWNKQEILALYEGRKKKISTVSKQKFLMYGK